jgi:hypothetical protein
MPPAELLADMGAFNQALIDAGLFVDAGGLKESRKGARVADALQVLCRRAARADASWQPEESRAYFRGCEILDSWATWREEVEAEQTRSGLSEANKAFNDAGDEFDAVAAQLVDMPASTIDGVLAKATAIRYLFPGEAGLSVSCEKTCVDTALMSSRSP